MGQLWLGALLGLFFCLSLPRTAFSSERELRVNTTHRSTDAAIYRRSDLTKNTLEPSSRAASSDDRSLDRFSRRFKRYSDKTIELASHEHKSSFRVTGSVEKCYRAIAREFGLKVVFDSDFEKEKTVILNLDGANFKSSIRSLNEISKAFVLPLDERIFLVAEDSNAKRAALEPMVTATIRIPTGLTSEMIDQLSQGLKQVLEIKRVQVDHENNQIVLRDTAYRVHLAREICRHFTYARAEVLFEVELIAMKETEQVDFGFKLPASFPVAHLHGAGGMRTSKVFRSVPFIGLSVSKTILGVSIADAILTANQTKSVGRIIQQFQLRSIDGQPATLSIGERFPIKNAQFSAVVSNKQLQEQNQAGTLRPAFPSVGFEDLGLTFTATPRVHDANTVSIELEVETQLLSGRSANEIPILANRRFSSTLRLEANKTAVITGMQVLERRKNRSGLPWLASMPWIGNFFSVKTQRFNASDLMITLRPRILRLPQAEIEPSLILRYGPVERPLSAL